MVAITCKEKDAIPLRDNASLLLFRIGLGMVQ